MEPGDAGNVECQELTVFTVSYQHKFILMKKKLKENEKKTTKKHFYFFCFCF